jgi:hypothetical protein
MHLHMGQSGIGLWASQCSNGVVFQTCQPPKGTIWWLRRQLVAAPASAQKKHMHIQHGKAQTVLLVPPVPPVLANALPSLLNQHGKMMGCSVLLGGKGPTSKPSWPVCMMRGMA